MEDDNRSQMNVAVGGELSLDRRERTSAADALLNELEQLTRDLADALTQVDTDRMLGLVGASSTCIQQIARFAWADSAFRDRARDRLRALEPLRDRNDRLLEHVLAVSDSAVRQQVPQGSGRRLFDDWA